MNEAYCGKNCETCAQKEPLGCAGCGDRPFSPRMGECAIADCCCEKGHAVCATCTSQDHCLKLTARDTMPQDRLAKRQAAEARRSYLTEIAPVFVGGLRVLFWCMIVNQIFTILSGDYLIGLWPWMKWPGEIADFACCALEIAVLFRLSAYERQYRTAAWCLLAAVPLSLLTTAVMQIAGEWTELVVVLAVVGISILGLYANYKQYHAHAAMLAGLDDELSAKWLDLWKWTVYALFAIGGGLLVGAIVGFGLGLIGLLVLLAGVVGLFIVIVCEYVYTYRMAQAFRALAEQKTEEQKTLV
ncbi:MAG: DUF3795 domain-containing protein [Butyricicoccus sp.]|nr:DUF3795 domain-containing protein [Butyricicoccus sp.]